MYKKLGKTEGEWNEERVFLIREMLNEMKKNHSTRSRKENI